jgi:hypothetical protein
MYYEKQVKKEDMDEICSTMGHKRKAYKILAVESRRRKCKATNKMCIKETILYNVPGTRSLLTTSCTMLRH